MSLKRNPSRNVVNFSAGPSALPYEVLETAQKELCDYGGLGVSVMEISHRSATFSKILNKAETSIRELLSVPENYHILFLQGGGNGQFAAVALNFMNFKPSKSADYLVTGYWSERAAQEATKYGKVNLVLPKVEKYEKIVPVEEWKLNPDASYVYVCENETINGIEFDPDVYCVFGDVPLVADCSSNLFSRRLDISKYGCIFAGAQKNFGPAGVTLVIVREDLLGHQMKECPSFLDFQIQAGNNSLYQTPPTYSIYVCSLVFDWFKRHGGIEGIEKVNSLKSQLIYDTIENSDGFYHSIVDKKDRSRMTIPFRIFKDNKPSETLEKEFADEAEKNQNLRELKGHRSVGGLRASIFNAVSYEEVQILADFMKAFMKKHTNK